LTDTSYIHIHVKNFGMANIKFMYEMFIVSWQTDFPAVKLADLSRVCTNTKEIQIIFIYEEYINII